MREFLCNMKKFLQFLVFLFNAARKKHARNSIQYSKYSDCVSAIKNDPQKNSRLVL